MNVSLTPQLEKLVREKVESGMYNNASEVIREGLRLIEERDRKLAWLRAEIQKGLDEIKAGDYVEVDDLNEFFDQIDREVAEELAVERSHRT
jgi:antitoxin ParD1/3/4